jgi:hypothetical protein
LRVAELDLFSAPYIDEDFSKDSPVSHRYIHGGFSGTDTRFSFYLPPVEQYKGRFIQVLEGGAAGHERTVAMAGPLTEGALETAFALGAVLVESNQGHIADEPSREKPADFAVSAYLASMATARYARELTGELLGSPPHHGYIYGVSGGGVRSIVCLERGEGTWDGAVPCAIPHGGMFYALAEHAGLVLGEQLEGVIDACDVGGSGQPFAGLDSRQREVLGDLYRSGYARGAEFMLRPGYSPVGYGMTSLFAHDPEYFEAFWSEPGYLGHDTPELLEASLVSAEANVVQVLTVKDLIPPGTDEGAAARMVMMMGGLDAEVAAVLGGIDDDVLTKLIGADVVVTSGTASGRRLYCTSVIGPVVIAASYDSGPVFADVMAGDTVEIDNRNHLAFRHAYRHQVTVEEDRFPELHPEWRHLVVDGVPIYPQRRPAWDFSNTFGTKPYLHRFKGKMILVENALDGTNWPAHGHNYASRVRENEGARVDDVFRLYWVDHAAHGPASLYPPGVAPVVTTRVIEYQGLLLRAVADLVAWVEEGIEPPASTGYTWGVNGKLELASTAAGRGGLQPVVNLSVNGSPSVAVGKDVPVTFEMSAVCPPGAGVIVDIEWDFDGSGAWPERETEIPGSAREITRSRGYQYSESGTYFTTVRVWTQRSDCETSLYRVPNLSQVRVIVA